MKLTVNRESILDVLEKVIGAVEHKSTTPVLTNVLLKASDKGLQITGTDLDTEISGVINNTGIEEPGETCVSARKLFDICKAIPPENVISIKQDGSTLVLESTRSRFELLTLSPEDFPLLDDIEFSVDFELAENVFLGLMSKTAFAMAAQDVRYYLNGMLFQLDDKQLTTVATDGHRLALSKTQGISYSGSDSMNIIVPRKGINELVRLLKSDSSVSLKVLLSANHLRLVVDNIRFTSKLIDGKYPDYQAAIPASSQHTLEIDRTMFRDTLTRVAILSNEKFRGVLLRFSEDLLTLQSNNPERESAKETVDIDYKGDIFEVGFNVRYLQDAISHLSGEKISLALNSVESSTLIQSLDDPDTINVVMPVRL